MRRICSWCGSILREVNSSGARVSHSLCAGCLEDLQLGLAAQGLRAADDDRQPTP